MARTSTHRNGLLACCAALSLWLVACGEPPDGPTAAPPAPVAPDTVLTDFVSRLKPTDPYRDPDPTERQTARRAVTLLVTGDHSGLPEASGLLAGLGFAASRGRDPQTGRDYALFVTEAGAERPWGLILVDLSQPVRLAVEVPHPNSDLHTEDIGLRLFRATPGSIMLVAGAHRRAGDGRADAAHNSQGLFQLASDRFARNRINQIQLHGFAEQSLPGAEMVVSDGQKRSTPALRRTADALDAAGFVACRAWTSRCGELEGTTNTQAEAARKQDAVFVHLEVTWTVRRVEDRRAELVAALVAADLPGR
ncbi:hypothetical protein TPA0907_49340 [Micromonospora humidisoli]|uniref:hypothetical protein n=1 Tax=Micromonospora sp. AKA109 TaxID=2733865 RepID=UPI0022CADDC8|nr:hypothetical protein [Micromonospora sp. AKA109]GHJ10567.1 hypothetical protein TPA0907_49340 [Micromonospora sp. AKA109]